MTGVPGSEGIAPALAFSVKPRTFGAVARAPTVAAPIAAPCKNFRRDILFFGSSTIVFPSEPTAWSPNQTAGSPGRHDPSRYFVVCNSACYKRNRQADHRARSMCVGTIVRNVGDGIRTRDLRMPQERRGSVTAKPYESDAPPG